MLLDIGVGIIASIALDHFFVDIPFPYFLAGGIVFALLPDMDFLLTLKKRTAEKSHEHRNIFHYPLIFIPAGIIVFSIFDYRWTVLFAVTTLLHFIHDSIGVGWGVRWLYPFTRKHYAFFYHYDTWRNGLPKKLFYAWSPEDVDRLSSQYGDKEWIKNIYLKFHPYAIVELLVFLFALVILLVK